MIIHWQRYEIDTAITTKQPFLLLFGWIKLNAKVDKFNFVSYFCIRKSYPNRQSDADHGNWNGCQLITRKRGNSSNFLDFKGVYPFCRITEYIGTKYPQKQKQPGRRADSTETGKSAATSIRSGIPRAARVKDRRNRSAQRYSSMSVSCEPIRDRSGRRQAVAPLLTEAARRSVNTTGFASGERKSARKKTDIFPQGNRLGIFPCTAASRHEQPANGGKRTKRLRFCIASYRTKQAPTRKQSTKNKRLWKKSNRPHSKKRTRPR